MWSRPAGGPARVAGGVLAKSSFEADCTGYLALYDQGIAEIADGAFAGLPLVTELDPTWFQPSPQAPRGLLQQHGAAVPPRDRHRARMRARGRPPRHGLRLRRRPLPRGVRARHGGRPVGRRVPRVPRGAAAGRAPPWERGREHARRTIVVVRTSRNRDLGKCARRCSFSKTLNPTDVPPAGAFSGRTQSGAPLLTPGHHAPIPLNTPPPGRPRRLGPTRRPPRAPRDPRGCSRPRRAPWTSPPQAPTRMASASRSWSQGSMRACRW